MSWDQFEEAQDVFDRFLDGDDLSDYYRQKVENEYDDEFSEDDYVGSEASLQKAIEIAVENHAGQVDKAGAPYVTHPLRVMHQMDSEAEQIVAVLHDVVEDTKVSFEDLRREGFDIEVLKGIDSVTRRNDEDYDEFILRAAANPIGYKVKMADLHDNLDLSRIAEPTSKDYKRLAKYEKALKTLKAMHESEETDLNTISSTVIAKTETEGGATTLSAEISKDSDLVINDYFIGKMAQEVYGHDDSESYVTVKGGFKDTLLLLLLQEQFEKCYELREWLDSKGVPYDFDIWP